VFALEGNVRTGFVDAPIWSDKEVRLDEKTKLFATLFNAENSRVDFVVEFSNNNDVIGKTDVSIWPKEAKVAVIDWTPSIGRSVISAKIISAKIDGVVLEIQNINSKKLTYNVSEESPAVKESPKSNTGGSNKTQLSNLIEKINWKSGSFGDKSKIFVISVIENIESWRSSTEDKIVSSIDKVKESRKDLLNMKPEVKAMSFIHLGGLQILKFIFSVGTIFYGLFIVLSIVIIRKIFGLIFSIFRRRSDNI
jgi:hypothetical protein